MSKNVVLFLIKYVIYFQRIFFKRKENNEKTFDEGLVKRRTFLFYLI